MHDPTRNRRRLPSAPMLLIVLAITTGWMQPAAPTGRSLALAAGRSTDDLATPAARVENAAIRPEARDQHPSRTFAAIRKAASAPPVTSAAHSISGRNHFWFPALGISRPVQLFQCSRRRAPDNVVYRWVCAGRNNVYILGHAWGVLKPLHDAYAAGRLHVGMVAMYADGSGRIRSYRVTEWRVVDPVNSNWAIADQSVPSMTLQTCVGPNGRYRLNVRLVAVD